MSVFVNKCRHFEWIMQSDGACPVATRLPQQSKRFAALVTLAASDPPAKQSTALRSGSAGLHNPTKRKRLGNFGFRGAVVYVQVLGLKTAAHVVSSCCEAPAAPASSAREFGADDSIDRPD